MKRIAIFILLVTLVLGTFTACGNGNSESSVASTGNTDKTSEFTDADGNYVPRHEVKDMNGKTFTIIVRGPRYGTYQSDDFTTESELYGDLINDAVQMRNDKVESLYNVTLNVIRSDNVDDDVRLDCTSNTGMYDAIMPALPSLATFASEQYLVDLNTLDNFDADAPWYDQNCSNEYSFGGKLFFTTGDITILNKVNTPSILFNKEMVSKYELDNPYQLVREKKWTFDKLVEMASSVDSIVTPDGSYSNDNIYGMVGAYGDSLWFYGASGERICAKDADNLPYLAIGENERSITIAQKILETVASAEWEVIAQEDFPDASDIWEASFEVFYNGRALFRPSVFSATTKLRSRSNIDFGIVPMPLMDDTQTEYYSYCSTGSTAGIAIPVCAEDPEFSAYMIEAYSAWAKNYLTVAYYEINLLYKDVRDEESAEMLDIIFSNIVYDIGECYNVGGIKSMFSDLTKEHSSDIVSALDAKKIDAQIKIDELIEIFAD